MAPRSRSQAGTGTWEGRGRLGIGLIRAQGHAARHLLAYTRRVLAVTGAHSAHMSCGIREKRKMTRALDRARQCSLMLGAGAGLAAGLHASAIRNEPPPEADILLVDDSNLFRTHDTDTTPATPSAS